MALIPQFGGLIWTLLAFVIALSVIVAIHEYGHYIVGRWSGIHADVFSLGFGPVIYSRYDKRGTKWQIAALPFGGYVKFAGDADAASRITHAVVNVRGDRMPQQSSYVLRRRAKKDREVDERPKRSKSAPQCEST